jgi:hypothetical protein
MFSNHQNGKSFCIDVYHKVRISHTHAGIMEQGQCMFFFVFLLGIRWNCNHMDSISFFLELLGMEHTVLHGIVFRIDAFDNRALVRILSHMAISCFHMKFVSLLFHNSMLE